MLANIQGLRWFAALSVVVFHANVAIAYYRQAPMQMGVAAAGVDIFFVISGFIMVHTTRDSSITPARFWTNRAVRIVPMYWLATLAAMAIFATGVLQISVRAFDGADVITSFFFIPQLRYDLWLPILPVGWTLIFEMLFYFLFGLALVLRNQTAAVTLLGVFFVAAWAFGKLTSILPPPAEFLTTLVTLEFAAGAALALIFHATEKVRLPAPRVLGIGAIVAGVALILMTGATGLSLWEITDLRALLWGGPAVLIVAGGLILERAGIRFTSSSIPLLGAASYSIYLVHVVVLELVLGPAITFLPDLGGPMTIGIAILAIIAAVFAGVVVHLWIERPMHLRLRGGVNRLFKPRAGSGRAGINPASG